MNISTSTEKDKLAFYVNKIEGVNVIYDCGSRDALDGIELFQSFKANELHVFECNPPSVNVCRNNLTKVLGSENEGKFWHLNNTALSDFSGTIDFRPIDVEKTITTHSDGNPGASSIFEANSEYKKESYVQNVIQVPCTTLNDYSVNHSKPDLLWMDLQGAELLTLKGASNILDDVKIIHVEVGFREMYKGQCLFWELNKYLMNNNFKLVSLDIGKWPKLISLYKFLRTGPWVGNAIYINNDSSI